MYIGGTQRICSSKYLFLWNLRLASKEMEQINSFIMKFLTFYVKCDISILFGL